MLQNSYAIFSLAGYSIGLAVFAWMALRSGRRIQEVLEIGVIATISSLFGAKIFHTFFEAAGHSLPNGEVAAGVWDLLKADPWHWTRLFSHGHVFFGGFLLASLATWLALRIKGVERPIQYADYFAPGLAIGLGIGRVGCYFGGCCFGRPTDLFWLSTSYPGPLSELGPILPVQLFESAFVLVCFVGLMFAASRPHRDGFLFLLFVIFYASFRFIIEFFRADLDRGLWLGETLSTSQIISALILISIALYYSIDLGVKVREKLS